MNWRSALLAGLLVGALATVVLLLARHNAEQGNSAVNHHVTAALVAAADRACKARQGIVNESNRRIGAHVTDRNILLAFIEAAARARRAAWERTHQPEDKVALDEYERLLAIERSRVHFRPLPPVVCPPIGG